MVYHTMQPTYFYKGYLLIGRNNQINNTVQLIMQNLYLLKWVDISFDNFYS